MTKKTLCPNCGYRLLRHSVSTAHIIIVSQGGQEFGYTVPVDLVLFLLWFLGSSTAQALAMVGMWITYQLRLSWLWLTDWPAWEAGLQVVMEDLRSLGRVANVWA
jgi:hypothetical protein